MKQSKKHLLPWLILGIAAGFLICLLLLIWFLHAFFFGPAPTVYEGAEHYEKRYENRIHSGLMLFPETIPSTAGSVDFYYSWRDTLNFPTAQIHLSCAYTPDDYQQEISRLSSVSKQIGTHFQQVYLDKGNDFSCPAYVAVAGNNIWEYALLFEESHTIHYIFTEYCSSEDIQFDRSYLPKNFDDTSRLAFGEGFSIYEVPVYEGSEITAVDGDYSNNAVVSQSNGHYVDSGNYSLCVYTDIDKNGRETITGCTLLNLELDTKRNWNTKEESWEFSELNGKVYQDIKLNKDRTQAIITWKDETGIQEAIFDIAGQKFLKISN